MKAHTPSIHQREYATNPALSELGPVLSQIYSARGITQTDELELTLKALAPFHSLKGVDRAVSALITVVREQKKLLVVGDFDADGATSTALVIRALRMLGATQLDYLVPDRFELGYGLSPGLVELARERKPDLIMTVDNGIASVAGVEAANRAGIPVIVTDHHLPGDALPDALAIVNPNQPGCEFPSKSACGCAGIFNAPVHMPFLAHLFLESGMLANLRDFTSRFGADFYRVPYQREEIVLRKQPYAVPDMYGAIVPFMAGKTLDFSLVDV